MDRPAMAGSRHSAVAIASISASIGVDLPIPQKPTLTMPATAMVAGSAGGNFVT
jgi:hypothetical protein